MLKRSYLKTLNDKRLRDLFDQYSDALDSLKKESLLKVDNKRLKRHVREIYTVRIGYADYRLKSSIGYKDKVCPDSLKPLCYHRGWDSLGLLIRTKSS